METFLETIASPYWWLSVVAAGIAINLTSAYLKPVVDSRLATVSSWWSTRSERRRAEWVEFINRLCQSDHEQVMASFRDLRHRSRAIYSLVISALLMSLATKIAEYFWLQSAVSLIAAGVMFASFREFFIAARLNSAIWSAIWTKEQAKEQEGPADQ